MRLLITRPLDDARRTARALAARGHEAIVAPVMEIRPLPAVLPEGSFQAVLLTSANAARRIASDKDLSGTTRIPAFCVGARTGEAAREAGVARIRAAEGNAASLAALLRAEVDPAAGPLLHLSGRHVAVDLGDLLRPEGYEVLRLPVYESVAADSLPAEAAAAMERGLVEAVLLYSPRAAHIFCDLAILAGLEWALAGLPCACLSRPVADAAEAGGLRHAVAAERPEEDALFAAAEGLPGLR